MRKMIDGLKAKGEPFDGLVRDLGDIGDIGPLPAMRVMRSAAADYLNQGNFAKGNICHKRVTFGNNTSCNMILLIIGIGGAYVSLFLVWGCLPSLKDFYLCYFMLQGLWPVLLASGHIWVHLGWNKH